VVAKIGQVRPPVLMVGPARISMTGTLNAFLEALPLEVPLEVEDRKFYVNSAGQTSRCLMTVFRSTTTTASGGSETLVPGYSFIRAVVGYILLFLLPIDHWCPLFLNTCRSTPISTNISVPKPNMLLHQQSLANLLMQPNSKSPMANLSKAGL